jgi:putative DNA primase/helicase
MSGAREIAQQLGRAVRVGHDWRCNCPIHQGHSLTLADGRDGKLLVRCWGGCEWRDIFPELRSRGLLIGGPVDTSPEREDELRRAPEAAERAEIERLRRRIAAARDLSRHSKDAAGTPVEVWLRTRGLLGRMPPVLRYLQHCPHRNGGYYPAMVAPIVNVAGEQIGIHKTFLRPDGTGKADVPKSEQRETCGLMKGGAVRLGRVWPDGWLIIGEGIETSMSAMLIYRRPAWAALSACGVENLILPPAARKILICADRDENGVGEQAARNAGQRWLEEGRDVRLALPPELGDFNDLLTGKIRYAA